MAAEKKAKEVTQHQCVNCGDDFKCQGNKDGERTLAPGYCICLAEIMGEYGKDTLTLEYFCSYGCLFDFYDTLSADLSDDEAEGSGS